MKFIGGFIFAMLFSVTVSAQSYRCLPADVKEDTVVDNITVASPKGEQVSMPVTVKQALKKLKAKCSHGKLKDRRGKEIRFFQMQGCWGTPPPGYQDLLEKQRTDLAAMKKKYTVIEMTCNPSGFPRP